MQAGIDQLSDGGAARLDSHRLVFSNQPIDSVLPDLAWLNSSALATETSRARGAEQALTAGLTSEMSRATFVEGNRRTNLANEVGRATAAEQAITTNLANERIYVDGTFLKTTGGRVGGDLTITGVLHLQGGVSSAGSARCSPTRSSPSRRV